MKWHWASLYPFLSISLLPFLSISLYPFVLFTSSYGLHVVSRKHALLTSALHSSIHPSFIDRLNVHNHVSIKERHLVFISCGVIIYCAVTFLKKSKCTHTGSQIQKNRIGRETGTVQQAVHHTNHTVKINMLLEKRNLCWANIMLVSKKEKNMLSQEGLLHKFFQNF